MSAAQEHLDDPAWLARIDLAAAYRLCVRHGFHEAIDNHLSVLLAGDDQMLLNPFPLHWSEVTASNLIVADMAGNRVAGTHEVEPTAYFIHAAIHRHDPDTHRCVMHTHMPYATALCARQGGRLRQVHQNATMFWDAVAYDDDYRGLVLDDAEGARIARAMGSKPVLFLANHGVITSGASVAEAFERLYFLERACQIQLLAEAGGRLREMPQAVAAETAVQMRDGFARHAALHFAALKRLLDREEPDYAQ